MYSKPSIASHTVPVTWILVADERQAQIYVRRRVEKIVPIIGNSKHHQFTEHVEYELAPVPNMRVEAESADTFQTGRHQLGKVFESASPAHHMSEPHITVQDLVVERLVKKLAEKLHGAAQKNTFGHLVLVAAPRMLGKLRAALGDDVLKFVTSELQKDLVHCDAIELEKHLQAVV
jgi:protein required for attachment to host cells